MTATLHLISGLPCAGKSTYAQRLAAQRNAAHFSLDRWLITLFGRYSIEVAGYPEHVRRVYACRDVTWTAATELLRRGADVVLDDGFFRSADRRHYVEAARQLGVATAVHYLDTAPEVLHRRLAARNREPGEFHFEITPEALDSFITFFEVPGDDEGAEIVVVRDRGGRRS